MEVIDGNHISKSIIEELKTEVQGYGNPAPTIAFIRVGEDPASVFYVNKKQKVASAIGIKSKLTRLPESITEEELLSEVDKLNANTNVHGILIQAPLPGHVSERNIFNRVLPEKDVDGFTATNLGKLCQEDETGFVACTPAGIVEIFRHADIATEGKHVVVLGRSLIVGKPAALLMLKKCALGNATVTVCHSRTKNLKHVLKEADIIIAAIGKPLFVKADMVKKGVIVIDVGINRVDDASRKSGYRLVGDVDYEAVAPLTAKITPVPGGVGPMTVAMLMRNTVKAYKQKLPSLVKK